MELQVVDPQTKWSECSRQLVRKYGTAYDKICIKLSRDKRESIFEAFLADMKDGRRKGMLELLNEVRA